MNKSLKKAVEMSLNRQVPEKALLIDLLQFDIESKDFEELGEAARLVAKKVDNTGKIWASIGMDTKPCPMNCHFCSFGEAWSIYQNTICLDKETILEHAKHFIESKVRWITLRTTEEFDSKELLLTAKELRNIFPGKYGLVANTGDATAKNVDLLMENGYEIVYHALRLREGIDTPFSPEKRIETLKTISASPLELAYLIEPVGPEHTSWEIAESILTAIEVGATLSGAMARIPVIGTPLFEKGQISEKRLAQIIAVSRIAGGYFTPNICAHPPSKMMPEFGANVLVAEIGTIPRDHEIAHSEWNGYSIQNEKDWFLETGYTLWEDTDEKDN